MIILLEITQDQSYVLREMSCQEIHVFFRLNACYTMIVLHYSVKHYVEVKWFAKPANTGPQLRQLQFTLYTYYPAWLEKLL